MDVGVLLRGWKQAVTLVGVFSLLIAGVMIAMYAEGIHQAHARQELNTQADVLARTVAAPLLFDDRAGIQEFVSALGANPQLEAAAVYNIDDQAVAQFSRSGAASPPDRALPQSAFGRTKGAAVSPVFQGGELIGQVYLRAAPDSLVARLARHGGTALLVLTGSLFIWVFGSAQAALRQANTELRAKADDLAVEITERERAEAALRQAQKMEAMGQLTGGVAHDFNNLLMIASGGLDLLDRTTDPKRRARLEDGIRQALDRGAQLTRQLLAFARRTPLHPEVVEVKTSLAGVRLLLDRSLREDLSVEMRLADDLWPVEIDPAQLEVAVLNLALNARDAMPNGGVITITAANRPAGSDEGLEGDYVCLCVADTGAGIAPENLARVFEPFFTTKEVGRGTGLGLSQVYGFIRASGGEIRIESALGEGARVLLYLPRATKPLADPADSLPADIDPGTGRVLLVEDDEGVAAFVGQMFESLGWTPVRAADASEALRLLETGEVPDLVFSDMVMPGEIDGITLARRIAQSHPGLPILLTTGYSEAAVAAADEGRRLLAKPYRLKDLAAELDALRRGASAP